jgi:hypothetical protein
MEAIRCNVDGGTARAVGVRPTPGTDGSRPTGRAQPDVRRAWRIDVALAAGLLLLALIGSTGRRSDDERVAPFLGSWVSADDPTGAVLVVETGGRARLGASEATWRLLPPIASRIEPGPPSLQVELTDGRKLRFRVGRGGLWEGEESPLRLWRRRA